MSSIDVAPGLRERKKLATRDALHDAAMRLFEAHGVDGTTVEEIAAAVDVSPRTFHRYFASKEEVVFAGSEQRRQRFRAALAERPSDEPLLESLRRVVLDMTSRFVADPEPEARRQRLLRREPGLSARRSEQTTAWQQVFTEHAAARLSVPADDPLAVLVGACTSAAMRTALDHWLDFPESDYTAVVDRCFALLADLGTATSPTRAKARR